MEGRMPRENWMDGLLVTQLMMAAYKSAEQEKTLGFSPGNFKGYTPDVMRGEWRP